MAQKEGFSKNTQDQQKQKYLRERNIFLHNNTLFLSYKQTFSDKI